MQTVYIKHEAEIEKAAKIIYDSLPYTPTMFHPHKPEWKDKDILWIQDLCRNIAYQILNPHLKEINQLKASISELNIRTLDLTKKDRFPLKHK